MAPAIRIEDLGKKYRLLHDKPRANYRTLREALVEAATAPFRRFKNGGPVVDQAEEFWALKDISFNVQPGEVVGIIGRNGAGKSTLLKILSRITKPTTGRVEINGRVGSLLEVGTGFHPELTGRENVYLNGSILGMSKREIDRQFDEIIAFAEVERFLDTPVKRYSSGMYVRLAFAVAAYLDPEILIVDEVLAVGDAQFQKKCLGKMGEVSKGGRTVLFVSHNLPAVQSLCGRAVWLHEGEMLGDGRTADVIRNYLGKLEAISQLEWPDLAGAPGNEYVRLRAARIRPIGDGVGIDALNVHEPFNIEFDYQMMSPDIRLNLSISLTTQDEVCAFNVSSYNEKNWDGKLFPKGHFRTVCHVPGDLLNNGRYTVSVLFVRDTTIVLCELRQLISFDVGDSAEDRGAWYGRWTGVFRPRLTWKTEQLATNDLVSITAGRNTEA